MNRLRSRRNYVRGYCFWSKTRGWPDRPPRTRPRVHGRDTVPIRSVGSPSCAIPSISKYISISRLLSEKAGQAQQPLHPSRVHASCSALVGFHLCSGSLFSIFVLHALLRAPRVTKWLPATCSLPLSVTPIACLLQSKGTEAPPGWGSSRLASSASRRETIPRLHPEPNRT